MKPFTHERAKTPAEAAAAAARTPGAKFIAGGTNLLDLMKLQIETPKHLIDVNGLGLDKIEPTPDGGPAHRRPGAQHRLSSADVRVRRDYGLLSRAIVAGASGQLRNKATTAGNLLQRTRCPYFYDTNMPCNKRQPGSGCSALEGVSRQLAVIGDERRLYRDLSGRHGHRHAGARRDGRNRQAGWRHAGHPDRGLPPPAGQTPRTSRRRSTPGELITAVTLPKPLGGTHIYHKVRDRASYAYALISIAAVVQKDGTGRVAVGGVAHKPWRVEAAEADMPKGAKAVTATVFAGARPTDDNQFKLRLAERTLGAVLTEAKG